MLKKAVPHELVSLSGTALIFTTYVLALLRVTVIALIARLAIEGR